MATVGLKPPRRGDCGNSDSIAAETRRPASAGLLGFGFAASIDGTGGIHVNVATGSCVLPDLLRDLEAFFGLRYVETFE